MFVLVGLYAVPYFSKITEQTRKLTWGEIDNQGRRFSKSCFLDTSRCFLYKMLENPMTPAKTQVFLKKSSPDSKADFGEKLVLRVWRLILRRYDIILHI